MYWSRTFIPTMKETPEGAEIPSHVLMLRAGLISQVMAGAYTYLPLGLRSLRKAEQIVREEMDRAGAVELLMPALSPMSLWERTGRARDFGNVLIHFELTRGNRKVHLALGPTHEEIITDMASRYISSYRQLPITFYQIQTKFRNEERPRFGVLRTSEFLMKDAYSFDASVEQLNESYQKMYEAYCRIFERAGLDYLPVEAESGPIGGDASHEFMVPAQHGEDVLVHCSQCGYAANTERAARRGPKELPPPPAAEQMEPLELVDTPGASTIEQVSRLLSCQPQQLIKTLIYLADGKPVAVLIRGDHEANENKIRRFLGAEQLELAPPEVIEKVTGAPVGFAGPVGLKEPVPLYADWDVAAVTNAVVGANQAEKHYRGANRGRDFQVPEDHWGDLRVVVDGDPCPRCEQGKLQSSHAIEVGHVFKLGTKYSRALGARFNDADEKLHDLIMGCYGIGINRILAALIETSHDEHGIIWPLALAPYEVVVLPLNVKDEAVRTTAVQLHDQLEQAGVEVLLDDRDVRAGVKFNDADLIGFPLRVTVGGRGLKQGQLEVKWRWESESRNIPLESAAEQIQQLLEQARQVPFRQLVQQARQAGAPAPQ